MATELVSQGTGEVFASNDLILARDPEQVLEEAMRAAKALKRVIDGKDKPVKFNGETYLEFEDWQTCARFFGITAKVVSTTLIEMPDGTRGYEAHAVAIYVPTGQEVSAADAMCLNDEDKWRARAKYEWRGEWPDREKVKIGEEPVPLFQLRSMAQTRACAKALRNVVSWVVVLAGYRPTPAEEMPEDGADQPKAKRQSNGHGNGGEFIGPKQQKELIDAAKQAGWTGEAMAGWLKDNYGQWSKVPAADFQRVLAIMQSGTDSGDEGPDDHGE